MIKKLLYKKISLLLFILIANIGLGQGFTESESIKTGGKEFDKENYLDALPHFQYLLSIYPNNLEYNFKYGACLVYKKDITTAIKHLSYCEKNNFSDPRLYFYIGKINHLSYSFTNAINYYNEFKAKGSDKNKKKLEVENELNKCKQAKTLLQNYSELKVNRKQKAGKSDFYRYYNLKNLGGKIIVADEFQSKYDKKVDHHPVIYLQKNPQYIFYGSYGAKGENGKDIYMRRKTDNGEWSDPVLLSDQINTPFDEDYAYLHPDGKTLYFSSKGHTGLGGYDIFKCSYNPETNEVGTPINLDFKINSPDDDLFYIADPAGDQAYFASSRATDINSVNVYDIGITSYPMQNVLIAGNITGDFNTSETALKIEAKNDNGKSVDKTYLTPEQNDFLLTLPRGGKYTFSVTSKTSKLKIDAVLDVPFITDLTPLKIIIDYKVENNIENITIIKRFNEGVNNKDEILASYFRKIANPEVNPDFDPNANEASYDKSFISKKLNSLIDLKEQEQLKLKGQLFFAKENAQKSINDALEMQLNAEEGIANKNYEDAQEFQVKADNSYLNSKSYSNNVTKIQEIIKKNEEVLANASAHKNSVSGYDNAKLKEVTGFINKNQGDNIVATIFQKSFQGEEAKLISQQKTLANYNSSISDLNSQIAEAKRKLENTKKKKDKQSLEEQISRLESDLPELEQNRQTTTASIKDLQDVVNQSSNDVLIAGQVSAASSTTETSNVSMNDLTAQLNEYKQNSSLIAEEIENNIAVAINENNTESDTTAAGTTNIIDTTNIENISDTNVIAENRPSDNDTSLIAENINDTNVIAENLPSDTTNTIENDTTITIINDTVPDKSEQIKENILAVLDKNEEALVEQQQQTNYIYSELADSYEKLKKVEKQLKKESDDDKLIELMEERKALTIKTINYAKLLNEYQNDVANKVDNLVKGNQLAENGINETNQKEALIYLEMDKSSQTPSEIIQDKIHAKENQLIESKKQLNLANREITSANEKLDELGEKLNSEVSLTSEEKQNIVAEITQVNREITDISLAQKAYYNKSNSTQNHIIGLLNQQELVDYIDQNSDNKKITSAKDNSDNFDKIKEEIAANVSDEFTKDANDVLENETFDMNSEIVFLTKMEWVQTTYKNLVVELGEIGDVMDATPKTDRKYADLKNKTWVTQNRFFEKNFDNQLKFFEAKSELATSTEGIENVEEIKAKHQEIANKAQNLFNKAQNTKKLNLKNDLLKEAFTVLTMQDTELAEMYDKGVTNEYGVYVDKSEEELKSDIKILESEYDGLNNEIFDLTKQFEAEKDQTKRGQILKIKVKKEILAKNKLKLINDLKKLIQDKAAVSNNVASSEAEKEFYETKKEREDLLFQYISNTDWEDQSEMERIKSQYEEITQISNEIEGLYAQLKISSNLDVQEEIKTKIEGLNDKLHGKENNLFVKMINTNYNSITNKNNEIKEALTGYNPDKETAKRLEDLQKALQDQIRIIDSLKAIQIQDPKEKAKIKREIFKTQSTILDLQKSVLEEIDNNPSVQVASNNTTTSDSLGGEEYTGTNTTLNSALSDMVNPDDLEDYDVNNPVDSKDLNLLKNINEDNEEYFAFLKEVNILIKQIDATEKGSAQYNELKKQLVEKENAFLTKNFYDRYESFSIKAATSPVAKNAFSSSKIEMIKHDAEEQFLDAKNATDIAIKNNILKQAFLYVTKYEITIDSIEEANQKKRVSEYKKLSNNTLDFNIGNLQQDIFNLMNQINGLLEKYDKETDPYKKQQLLREKKKLEVEMQLKKIELFELNKVLDERNGIVAQENPKEKYVPAPKTNDKEIKEEISKIQSSTSKQIEELKGLQTELEKASNEQQALLDEIGKTDDPDKKKELYDQYQDLKALIAELQKKLADIQSQMNESSKRLSELQDQLNNANSSMASNNGNILLPSGVSNDPASFVSINFVNQFKSSNGTNLSPKERNQKNIPGLVYKVQIGAFYKTVPETNFKEYSPITYLQIPGSKYVRYYAGKFSQFGIANEAKNIIRGKSKYKDAFVVAFYNGQKVSVSKARQLEKGSQAALAELNALTNNTTASNNSNNSNNNSNATNTSNSNTANNTTTNNNSGTTNASNTTTANNNTSSNNATNNSSTNNNANSTNSNTAGTNQQGIPNSLFYTVQIGALSKPAQSSTFAAIPEVYDVKLTNGYIRYNSGKFKTLSSAKTRLTQVKNTISDAFIVSYYNGKKISVNKAKQLINQFGNDIIMQ